MGRHGGRVIEGGRNGGSKVLVDESEEFAGRWAGGGRFCLLAGEDLECENAERKDVRGLRAVLGAHRLWRKEAEMTSDCGLLVTFPTGRGTGEEEQVSSTCTHRSFDGALVARENSHLDLRQLGDVGFQRLRHSEPLSARRPNAGRGGLGLGSAVGRAPRAELGETDDLRNAVVAERDAKGGPIGRVSPMDDEELWSTYNQTERASMKALGIRSKNRCHQTSALSPLPLPAPLLPLPPRLQEPIEKASSLNSRQ